MMALSLFYKAVILLVYVVNLLREFLGMLGEFVSSDHFVYIGSGEGIMAKMLKIHQDREIGQ